MNSKHLNQLNHTQWNAPQTNTTPRLQWKTRWVGAFEAMKATTAVILLGSHAHALEVIEQPLRQKDRLAP